ncbi:fungal-specific transcription factor domain protein [Aspergillus uvarum CBS 121591]|uniref:Fungal-specific transcription factor domain protein n=1 Tax=Aspergillus uvarum CBS 121591 TaxID=1448315 RepID=A0A319DPX9_9EURO|nr:fungal-specific transcription factor domain protein [Aspergillus uvarum CBS 121591]PYH81322.1 fungal-specific transcription factor domain protein [Aspergillus uvarum CBS 121591]
MDTEQHQHQHPQHQHAKRELDRGGGAEKDKQQSPEPPRSKKRAKYTSVACNECKRRKLKCSGETVCSRCARDQVRCVYAPSVHAEDGVMDRILSTRLRTVDAQIEALQREMRALVGRLRVLEGNSPGMGMGATAVGGGGGGGAAAVTTPANHIPTAVSTVSSTSASAGLHRIMNRPKSPTYIGPTSAEFGIANRKQSHAGEAEEEEDEEDEDLESTAAPSPIPVADGEGDPLRCLGSTEALRLVTVYEHTVGLIYPCVDLDSVRAYVVDYFRDDLSKSPAVGVGGGAEDDWFFARDAEVLKILLATALLAESHGRSERAALLADRVEDQFGMRMKVPEVDMKELLILALLSIFHSYRDDEVIAWRTIGLAVRGSMQLGLHCQETWQKTGGVFPGELHRTWASRLFWCIYVLDRKWSFGTGLPFAIQDADMDTNLPEPDTTTPYLTCMISYARLSSKIWGLVVGWRTRPRAATTDYCAYLDFQVQQWIQSIPPELRFDPAHRATARGDSPTHADSMMTLQVLLALQANQLRILVYRQYLLSGESIEDSVAGASIAVETAKSTVHMLDYFSRVSEIYYQRPEPFNYFLISALAALFLAVLHGPARFSQVCRPEFYKAVEMVRRSSTRARTSRRLQKIIRSLKIIRLNLGKEAKLHPSPKGGIPREMPGEYAQGYTNIHVPSIRTGPEGQTRTQLHPQPTQSSSHGVWSLASTATDSTPAVENGCEDLTTFFEMAGGLYFDPRVQAGGEGVAVLAEGFGGELAAEDEALTRVMAELL